MAFYLPTGDFTPAPQGLHNAVCCDVEDLGFEQSQYGQRHRLQIVWQLEALNPNTGKRFEVRRKYGATLNPKSDLYRDLSVWRGKPLTTEEAAKFDIEKLLGIPCQLQVMHKISDNGKTYANVQAVLPPNPAAPAMRPDGYVRQAPRPQPETSSTPAPAPAMTMPSTPAVAPPPPATTPAPAGPTPF